MSLLCRLGLHKTRMESRAGRVEVCARCGCEKRHSWSPIPNPELAGRQLTRPRTRGERA